MLRCRLLPQIEKYFVLRSTALVLVGKGRAFRRRGEERTTRDVHDDKKRER